MTLWSLWWLFLPCKCTIADTCHKIVPILGGVGYKKKEVMFFARFANLPSPYPPPPSDPYPQKPTPPPRKPNLLLSLFTPLPLANPQQQVHARLYANQVRSSLHAATAQ